MIGLERAWFIMSISKARKKEIEDFADWAAVQPPKIDAQVHYDFEDSFTEEEDDYYLKMLWKSQDKIDKGILKFPDDFILHGA